MRNTIVACALVFATFATPLVLRSQSAPEQTRVSTDAFAGIGEIRVRAVLEVEGKSSPSAPTLEQMEDAMASKLEGIKLNGTLPAELVVRANSFTSKVTGDVVYSLHVELVRPVSVLGTLEVTNAAVWSVNTVGRGTGVEVKTDMLDTVMEKAAEVRGRIER